MVGCQNEATTEESSDLYPSVYPTWCPKLWNNTLKAILSLQLQDVMVWQVALMGTQRICAKSRDPQGLLKAFFEKSMEGAICLSETLLY